MPISNHFAAAGCDVVFKTLPASNVVGVWWVNPARKDQVLHVGQYHSERDAWLNILAGREPMFLDDAGCLAQRPAVILKEEHLPAIRAFAAQILKPKAA